MVLIFRFFGAVATARLRPSIEPLETAVMTMRAWPNDIDANMHVTSSRYLGYMDVARMEMLARMRLLRRTWNLGWRPIQGASILSFRKSILPFEKFRVRSRIVCWDEKWFYFEHVIEKMSGEIAAVGNVRGLFRNKEGNIPPSALAELTGHHIDSPPMPESVARFRAALVRE